MKTQKVTLPAGGSVQLNARGLSFRLIDAPFPVLVEGEGIEATLAEGQAFEAPDLFDRLRLTNTDAATPQTITVFTGGGSFDDSRVLGSVSADVLPADHLETTPDVTLANGVLTAIAPANATRKTVIIQADENNTVTIRVGDANTGAARGHRLQPGAAVGFSVRGEVSGFASVAGQKVTVTEEVA